MNYITKAIGLLRFNNYYGAGENIEIAKGKNQIVDSWKVFTRKLKRSYYGNREKN